MAARKEGTTPGDGKTSPFGNGMGATQAGGDSGAHNFLEDPNAGSGDGGSRDFTSESHASGSLGSPVKPNPDSVVAGQGGAVLQADPTPVSKTVSGTAAGVQGVASVPFKNLK